MNSQKVNQLTAHSKEHLLPINISEKYVSIIFTLVFRSFRLKHALLTRVHWSFFRPVLFCDSLVIKMEDDGSTLSFSWKTPSSPLIREEPLAKSSLLSHPVIFQMVLKLLNLWDVTSLLTTGNADLRALINRSYKKLVLSNFNLTIERLRAPIISSPPFHLFHRYQLDSIELVLPNWEIPKFSSSPLLNMPRTLRHFTFSTFGRIQDKSLIADFLFIPFASLYPDLETLRLQSPTHPYGVADGEDQSPWKFGIENIPKNIRTLTLILYVGMSTRLAFEICHPIGELEAFINENKAQKMPTSSALLAASSHDPQASTPPYVHSSPSYLFERLEYFEWYSPYRYGGISPIPHKFVPSLRHYIRTTFGVVRMGVLPSRRLLSRIGAQLQGHSQSPPSELLTFRDAAPWEEDTIKRLPRSITSLEITVTHYKRAPMDFSRALPNLRIFRTNHNIDFNIVTFPPSLTSLTCDLNSSPLFVNMDSPPCLTELIASCNVRDQGLLDNLPSSLVRMKLVVAGPVKFWEGEVFSRLPSTLESFYLKVDDFSYEFLSLLPRELKELTIAARTMLLPHWLPGEAWTTNPVDFDIRALPPNLTRLSLLSSPYGLQFPHSMLAELPRSLRSLTISRVLLPIQVPESENSEGEDVPPTPQNASSSSSSSSSSFSLPFSSIVASITGLFHSATTAIKSYYPQVSTETIQQALDLLPPDCWCDIKFVAKIEDDTTRKPKQQPSNLIPSIAALLPNPRTIYAPIFSTSLDVSQFR